MVAYRFFPKADAAQDKIWDDTVEKWGEAQGVTYITGLHAHLQLLCKDRMLWRRLPQKLAVPADVEVFIRNVSCQKEKVSLCSRLRAEFQRG